MNNPYTPSIDTAVDPKWKSQIAIDLGRFALLLMIWLVVTYAVSLPASKLLTKDAALIVMSPFVPVGFLATAIAGETIWALLITLFAWPVTISFVVGALGVRKKRAWFAAISMGILYGLFLRLFYLMCDIA